MTKAKQQSCRSCAFWNKPTGVRALAGKHYECTAPLPIPNLPASVTTMFSFVELMAQAARGGRAKMNPTQGKNCPCWEIII